MLLMYEIGSDPERLFNLSLNEVTHHPADTPDLAIVPTRAYAGIAHGYDTGPNPIVAADHRGWESRTTLGAAALTEATSMDTELAVAAAEEPDPEEPEEITIEVEEPAVPPVPGDANDPPDEPPHPPPSGETDGEDDWDDNDRILAMFDSRLPRVDRETVRAIRASLADDPELKSRMVVFMQTDQPRLMQYVEKVALSHAANPKEGAALVEEFAVFYCLLAAQNVADRMDELYGFGGKDPGE